MGEHGEGGAVGGVGTETERQVALVTDTLYDSGTVDDDSPLQRPDMMMVYDRLRASLQDNYRLEGVQMSTRKGRVLASSLAEEERRMSVAERTAWVASTLDARAGSVALPADYAMYEEEGFFLFVIALDHLRLFVALFPEAPPEEEIATRARRMLMEL